MCRSVTAGKNLAPTPISFPLWKPEIFTKFMDFFINFLKTAYTVADKEAAIAESQDTPDWDQLLKFDAEPSDDDTSSDSSSDSEHEVGEKCRRHLKKGERAKKKRMVIKVPVIANAGIPAEPEKMNAVEIRKEELRRESVSREGGRGKEGGEEEHIERGERNHPEPERG